MAIVSKPKHLKDRSRRQLEADLKRVLHYRRDQIMQQVAQRLRDAQAEAPGRDDGVPDDAEMWTASFQQDMAYALIQIQRETLERIEAALGRLEAGVYGRCAECGHAIQEARLRALPFAQRCRDCEEGRERPITPPPPSPRLRRDHREAA